MQSNSSQFQLECGLGEVFTLWFWPSHTQDGGRTTADGEVFPHNFCDES